MHPFVSRHIRQIGLCKICMAMDEDLEYALLKCSHAKSFWNEAQLLFEFHLAWNRCTPIHGRRTSHVMLVLLIENALLWSRSCGLSGLTHGEDQVNPANSVRLIREALALLEIPRWHALLLPGYGWRPPEPDLIKINTIAAI